MVREPDATIQPTLQDHQLMSKHRVLGCKPQLRLEWRGQDGQNETKQPDHSASLGDFFTSSTRIRFSVHTPGGHQPNSPEYARQITWCPVRQNLLRRPTSSWSRKDPSTRGPRKPWRPCEH